MPRFVPAVPVAVLAAVVAFAQPNPPAGFSNWPMDELTLANGSKVQGLILDETPAGYRFQIVRRPPGKPTFTFTTFFDRKEVASAKRLNDAERAALKDRLAELDTNGEGERKRMESLELAPADWLGRPAAARRYDSEHFSLVSSAPEEVTRRSAVKLEQLYTAFARFLPPAVPDARPTAILLAQDGAEYKALLAPLGVADLLNPAVYDPRTNQILCGSELRKLGTELQTARIHHSQQLAGLDRYEAEVKKLYKRPELDRYLEAVKTERKKVAAADRANGAKFDQATARLFALLYHEAFHAYVSVFVYPPLPAEAVKAGKGTGELPRWLNEGLAQVFEAAVVEAGELRADHPDKERLARARDRLRAKGGDGLVPLADLLTCGKEAFLAHTGDQRLAADRAYLTSWALAYYLILERRVIGTPAFRAYLVAVNSGGDAREAFRTLVGQDVAAFEKDWHAYLLRLQPDGLGK